MIPSPREPFSRAWRGRNPITILVGMKGRYTRCFLFKCWRWKEIKIQFRFDSVRVYSRNRGRNSSIVSGGRYFPQMRYCFLSDIYFTSYSTHPIITSKKKENLLCFFNPPNPPSWPLVYYVLPPLFLVVCAVIYEWSTFLPFWRGEKMMLFLYRVCLYNGFPNELRRHKALYSLASAFP